MRQLTAPTTWAGAIKLWTYHPSRTSVHTRATPVVVKTWPFTVTASKMETSRLKLLDSNAWSHNTKRNPYLVRFSPHRHHLQSVWLNQALTVSELSSSMRPAALTGTPSIAITTRSSCSHSSRFLKTKVTIMAIGCWAISLHQQRLPIDSVWLAMITASLEWASTRVNHLKPLKSW